MRLDTLEAIHTWLLDRARAAEADAQAAYDRDASIQELSEVDEAVSVAKAQLRDFENEQWH